MSFVTGQTLCNVFLLKPPFSSQLLEQILSWSVHRRLELLVGTVHHQMHEKQHSASQPFSDAPSALQG